MKNTRHNVVSDHTLTEWANMTGRDQKTIRSAFRKIDYFPKSGERIPFKRIEEALFGEEHSLKIQSMRLANEKAERDAQVEKEELVQLADVMDLITATVTIPLSGAMAALPAEVSPICVSPETARVALTNWVENKVKPLLRSKLLEAKAAGPQEAMESKSDKSETEPAPTE